MFSKKIMRFCQTVITNNFSWNNNIFFQEKKNKTKLWPKREYRLTFILGDFTPKKLTSFELSGPFVVAVCDNTECTITSEEIPLTVSVVYFQKLAILLGSDSMGFGLEDRVWNNMHSQTFFGNIHFFTKFFVLHIALKKKLFIHRPKYIVKFLILNSICSQFGRNHYASSVQ